MPLVMAGPPVTESAQLLREVVICSHGTKPVADFLGVPRERIEQWTHGEVPPQYLGKLMRLREINGLPGRSQDPRYYEGMSFPVAL